MKGQRKSKSKDDGQKQKKTGSDQMGITDKIEAFILELMKQTEAHNDEWLTIQRNELADIFGCVPSQINYVISTRFSPERGYVVVSRRGGGGCVKIKHAGNGTEMTEAEAAAVIQRLLSSGAVSKREAVLMKAAVTDKALGSLENEGAVRASIMKSMAAAVDAT